MSDIKIEADLQSQKQEKVIQTTFETLNDVPYKRRLVLLQVADQRQNRLINRDAGARRAKNHHDHTPDALW